MPAFPLDPYAGPVAAQQVVVAKPQQSEEELTAMIEIMVKGTNQAFAERGIF